MRAPMPRQPDDTGLREVMTAIADLGTRMDRQFERADERVRKIEVDVAETKGRLTGIEGQLRQIPTLWQIVALVFAIFSAAFVLIRFGMPTGH